MSNAKFSMESALFFSAFAAYSAAFLLSISYLFLRSEVSNRWMWRVLSLGVALHLSSFLLRTAAFWVVPENRFLFPAHTLYGILDWLTLVMACVFWLVEGRHHLNILGSFVLPWTVLAAGAAALFADPSLTPLPDSLRSVWVNIHPMLLMTAYALFANAFGVGLALVIQQRQLKSRRPTELNYRLPALEVLDDLLLRITLGGFLALSCGLALGFVWAHIVWGRFWGWDPKEVFAVITWLLYAVYLYMRVVAGRRGRKPAYVSMAGFASVLVTFFGARVMSGLHGLW